MATARAQRRSKVSEPMDEAYFFSAWDEADQAQDRAYQKYKDQHGRPWGANIEIKRTSRHPCGPMEPLFQAPLYPPVELVRPDPNDFGGVIIDYDAWEARAEEAEEAFQKRRHQAAVTLYPPEEVDRALRDNPKTLRTVVGDGPGAAASIEVVRACRAGNPWLMGVPGAAKPAQAEKWFPEKPAEAAKPADPTMHNPFEDPWATTEQKVDAELRDVDLDDDDPDEED